LAQALLPSVSVVGINYPGHLERMGDPLADNVAQLADEIAAPGNR
jgi:surfactin synthase thioesterase subunit